MVDIESIQLGNGWLALWLVMLTAQNLDFVLAMLLIMKKSIPWANMQLLSHWQQQVIINEHFDD